MTFLTRCIQLSTASAGYFTVSAFCALAPFSNRVVTQGRCCSHMSTTAISATAFRNHLDDISTLRNDYFALRHGQSMANVAGIIAANPNIACTRYGLSDVGKEQAILAGRDVVKRYQEQLEKNEKSYTGILILSSDLLRAKETAETLETAAKEAGVSNVDLVIETRLRERGFGEWDGESDVHYQDVWNDDANDPGHEIRGVESVNSVTDRATKCIIEWDSKREDHMVLCVAHGDVLQILQTAFSKMDGSKHRTLDHLETATLRPLVLKVSS